MLVNFPNIESEVLRRRHVCFRTNKECKLIFHADTVKFMSPLSQECDMLDRIEGLKFSELYLKYVNVIFPITTYQIVKDPANQGQKIQVYAGAVLFTSAL